MSVQITDCTIRDGGYLLNKNSNPTFIKGLMTGLAEAGIDFVETGFLQDVVKGETLVYHDARDVQKYLPENRRHTQFLGFCDNSRYSLKNLNDWDGNSFKWLRISFAKHEIVAALEFCVGAQDKGYIVQFNPMDALSYTKEEWTQLLEKVNRARPGAVSIVDTFGAMYLDDLTRIFQLTDEILDKRIKIGLHSHDNLGLSCALAEQMIMLAAVADRDVMVDGSLLGMGRGAGNARTELLASFLNEKYGYKYDIPKLLNIITSYILPLRQQVHWGYDLPMFICGTKHAHVDNIAYLQQNTSCFIEDMYQIISNMPPSMRTRYGANYSKTDFTALQQMYEKYLADKEQK